MTEVQVPGPAGLHARPCHSIVAAVARFDAKVRLIAPERSADACSVLAVMTLGAMPGQTIRIEAHGSEASEVVAELVRLFEIRFEVSS